MWFKVDLANAGRYPLRSNRLRLPMRTPIIAIRSDSVKAIMARPRFQNLALRNHPAALRAKGADRPLERGSHASSRLAPWTMWRLSDRGSIRRCRANREIG